MLSARTDPAGPLAGASLGLEFHAFAHAAAARRKKFSVSVAKPDIRCDRNDTVFVHHADGSPRDATVGDPNTNQASSPLKLNAQQVSAAREVVNVPPMPEDHPAMGQLQDAFGEHTFFLHEEGLSIFAHPEEVPAQEGTPRFILIAAWTDQQRNKLGPIEPIDSGLELPSAEPGNAN